MLIPLVRLPGFKTGNRRALLRAIDLYATSNLDFGDALIVASMGQRGSKILYSYDTHFDRMINVTRRAPSTVASGE